MMNLKKTINFTTLREKGPNSIDVKNDEVVQLVTRESEIKVIITQEYFLTLLTAYNNILIRRGLRDEKTVSISDKLDEFREELKELMKISNEDEQEDSKICKKTGQKAAGNY